NSGTFFSITPKGPLKTLYNFLDIPDGNLPGATLTYYKGNFYSTTVGGGTAGIGTVFKITPAGSESVLYSFLGGSDGDDPQGPIYAFKGELYGLTTKGGGSGCGGNGCGTIFKVKP
ncbi:MAG TPA: choice-of-anchor tandem repeat GloVer-containing protein, partial [Candidatus Nitrosotalea sp.]|nr:choice-of-anchor tandem repeat GloVer-containing protein [Candidatus Nitrosotalea sp.]